MRKTLGPVVACTELVECVEVFPTAPNIFNLSNARTNAPGAELSRVFVNQSVEMELPVDLSLRTMWLVSPVGTLVAASLRVFMRLWRVVVASSRSREVLVEKNLLAGPAMIGAAVFLMNSP